ncbi:hypothetical protein BT63DRAFT_412142 [Microthyrium microscopicum]|uniref:MIT domain-containing protein n=1 Tax=Microthyrium microscopicum TaxID=703497 RepID=A0A6A6UGY1_9PEZI|nr:hypothetical protein BT63DRAFT_412142 [Microthyrium microscopicum]
MGGYDMMIHRRAFKQFQPDPVICSILNYTVQRALPDGTGQQAVLASTFKDSTVPSLLRNPYPPTQLSSCWSSAPSLSIYGTLLRFLSRLLNSLLSMTSIIANPPLESNILPQQSPLPLAVASPAIPSQLEHDSSRLTIDSTLAHPFSSNPAIAVSHISPNSLHRHPAPVVTKNLHLSRPSPSTTSPSTSPRKRASTSGSRYSPPPAFSNNNSPAVPNLPATPPIDSISRETTPIPTARDTPRVSSPNKHFHTSPVRSIITAKPLASPVKQGKAPVGKMVGDWSRKAMRSASGSRTVHQRAFSTDMNKNSQEEVTRQREQRERDRDRKAMLNKALQKAHTAVLLDNAFNYEGAVEAYQDACDLLHQVLVRSTADEEKKKLDQIRETYSKRINELLEMDQQPPTASPNKSLPARPASATASDKRYSTQDDDDVIIETATATVIERSRSPPKRDFKALEKPTEEPIVDTTPVPTTSSLPHLKVPATNFISLTSPMDPTYAPPPLSPRRIPKEIPTETNDTKEQTYLLPASNTASTTHSRGGSVSWLGPMSSGTSSQRSSTHSILDGTMMRKPFLGLDDTEAEFDAALDAAVEAAYDDGFEPTSYHDDPIVGNQNTAPHPDIRLAQNGGYYLADDDNEEEEERILASLDNKDYALEEFDFGLQNKSSMQRDSDGSQFSGSTWHSSVTSSRTTPSAIMSTVSEGSETTLISGGKVLGTLPRLSEETSRPDSFSMNDGRPGSKSGLLPSGSVRSRRMSGQNAKQLKIETQPTTKQAPYGSAATDTIKEEPAGLKSATQSYTDLPTLSDSVYLKQAPSQIQYQPPPVPHSAGSRPLMSPAETMVTISPATPGLRTHPENGPSPSTYRLPGAKPFLRKNKSSMSLKNRALSVSSPDGSDGSVATPMSTTFSYSTAHSTHALTRKATMPGSATTPSLPSFPDGVVQHAGSLTIFESDIHSPHSPGFPNPMANNAPVQLEPCPESVILRPFWLLRCVYQTIAHPRGGYVSTKLFVPRDVWRVKGVKLKAVEEKIAQLDVLTHALARLNQIDTNDMDAVHDEMNHFESTLDIVQAVLTKKLGHEVGTHGLTAVFRDAQTDSSNAGATNGDGAVSQRSSSKSYLSSWRKLRSKTSSTALATQASNAKHIAKDSRDEHGPTMATVPMTSMMNIKFAKRDITGLDVSPLAMGPNAAYMASLARLCDAVQILDQIARQVEDPGLKGSSSTHVGLELGVRHASEFFGFYVCRFVLADVGLLLDKYLKRGTEWVLA